MLASTATPARRPARRLAGLLAGGLAAGALVLGAGAGTAVAHADGCTYTDIPDAYVCAVVHGAKLRVDSVDVSRGKFPGGTIRDYHAEVTVRSPRGSLFTYRSGTHEGKTYTRAYMTVDVGGWFPDGSRLCATFFEGGDAQDTVCFRIHD
jgi:hypothetical protein